MKKNEQQIIRNRKYNNLVLSQGTVPCEIRLLQQMTSKIYPGELEFNTAGCFQTYFKSLVCLSINAALNFDSGCFIPKRLP